MLSQVTENNDTISLEKLFAELNILLVSLSRQCFCSLWFHVESGLLERSRRVQKEIIYFFGSKKKVMQKRFVGSVSTRPHRKENRGKREEGQACDFLR